MYSYRFFLLWQPTIVFYLHSTQGALVCSCKYYLVYLCIFNLNFVIVILLSTKIKLIHWFNQFKDGKQTMVLALLKFGELRGQAWQDLSLQVLASWAVTSFYSLFFLSHLFQNNITYKDEKWPLLGSETRGLCHCSLTLEHFCLSTRARHRCG